MSPGASVELSLPVTENTAAKKSGLSMEQQPVTHRERVRFRSGAFLILTQLLFLLYSLKYLLQPRRYPLFAMHSRNGGVLHWLKAGNVLGLTRQAVFRGKAFSAPLVPAFPSAAFDRMVANGGMNVLAAGTEWKRQIDLAILAVTRRCPLSCEHCYERYNTGGTETVSFDQWKRTIAALQRIGTSVIVLSGGEPMVRFEDVLELLSSADKSASDFHMHTSGMGVTRKRARLLREAGLTAAAVGLDDVVEARHDRLRGRPGSYRQALQAVDWFREEGILPYLNMCLTRTLIRSGDLWRYLELAKKANVAFIQMLEPRPCGGFLGNAADVLLTEDDRAAVMRFFEATRDRRQYRNTPIVYYVAYTEPPRQMGCMMGGLSHFAIDGQGNVTPCVFLPVGFGNILSEEFETIYNRMRKAIPHPVRATCPSLLLGRTLMKEAVRGTAMPVPHEIIREEFELIVHSADQTSGALQKESSGEPS